MDEKSPERTGRMQFLPEITHQGPEGVRKDTLQPIFNTTLQDVACQQRSLGEAVCTEDRRK
jgi:hypothetical protein